MTKRRETVAPGYNTPGNVEGTKFTISERAMFIETGYNLLSDPSPEKAEDFIKTVKKDLAKQNFLYDEATMLDILHKVASSYKFIQKDYDSAKSFLEKLA